MHSMIELEPKLTKDNETLSKEGAEVENTDISASWPAPRTVAMDGIPAALISRPPRHRVLLLVSIGAFVICMAIGIIMSGWLSEVVTIG